ncbi:S1 family peptidase [Prauserella cavernicola]|uniref:Trypsin-like peptidase domain-containing protein n=1 Tax=Prauserella cavernicola TaxID=2800127 RepID=A0A934V4X2_9PSEU|nr:serine protease [Prauserella cavernicola]MBK1785169.1 trypsin-like peptidase domain-containing protein [Prauserella cavernicola]
MFRRPLGALLAALLTFALVNAAPASAAPAVDLAGTVALSNCSGSIVHLAGTPATAPALVLSNGHCLEEGFPAPGEVIVDQPSQRSFTLLAGDGAELGTVPATKLLYATMTGTDASVYQLGLSYAELERTHGVTALELAEQRPSAGSDITVASGYWKQTYSCSVDGFVHELHEGDYVWDDSIRYTPECETIGGTSGSPIVDVATGEVVGVNNTGNENGERCTMNNPCEVAGDGAVTVREGINYGQQTYDLYGCLTAGNEIELGRPACELPQPA